MPLTAEKLISSLKKLLSYEDKFIALHEPYFVGNEWQYVKECLDTGWVSSVGKFVDKFEHDLSDFTGAKYSIAAVNGTSALHICYQLAGISQGDEVLVPSLTFIGTINPILYCGAVPHFIDSEAQHLGIDAALLDDYLHDMSHQKEGRCINRRTSRPIRALCVMHTLGHPVDLDALSAVCEKYNLILLEDAAEALGSYYKGAHVGHRGAVGALSFNGNKIITTGGGGAILTDHIELAKKAKHLTTTAKLPHPWAFQHDEIGFNYRLPNINSALGCAQLEKINDYLYAKREIAKQYQAAFADVAGIKMLVEPRFAKSNYWLNALLLDDDLVEYRDEFLLKINRSGIMTRPLWDLQHTLPMFANCPRMPLPAALDLVKRLIKLPSSAQLYPVKNNADNRGRAHAKA